MTPSPLRTVAAWSVHAYTALGLPLAMVASAALYRGDASIFFLTLCVAVAVDATDGALARSVGVRQVVPHFDGRRLDDLVDFLIFAFLPALAILRFELFPPQWTYAAAIPLLASGYGFCQERAKTDVSFVGFPSYWNIVIMYLYVLAAGPWINLVAVLTLSALVFVPIHYVYPTKTRLLRPVTLLGGVVWAAIMVAIAVNLAAPWTRTLALASLLYPIYYFALSGVHHVREARARRRALRS